MGGILRVTAPLGNDNDGQGRLLSPIRRALLPVRPVCIQPFRIPHVAQRRRTTDVRRPKMHLSETLAETARVGRTLPAPTARPRRRLVAAVAILATALGLMAGSAIPARADDDLAKALAAIAVVGIIAHAARAKNRPPAVQPQPAPLPRPVAATRNVPAACGIELSGSQTRATLYTESCIVDRGLRNLPTWCARPARIYGQQDYIYTADCLRDGGLRVPRGS